MVSGFISKYTHIHIPKEIIDICYYYYPQDDSKLTKYLFIGDILLNSKLATMKAKELIYQRLTQIVALMGNNNNNNRFESRKLEKLIPSPDCMRINSKKSETSNVIKNTWYDDCTVEQNNKQDATDTGGYWKSLYLEQGIFYFSHYNMHDKATSIKPIAIEKEKLFTPKYVVIQMIEYNGKKSGRRFEMIVERELTIKYEFIDQLSRAIGINQTMLRLVRARQYMFNESNEINKSKVAKLDWSMDKIKPNYDTLASKWNVKNGDYILFHVKKRQKK